ncbi:hypothetical protein ACFQFC_38510 [Amorphoplanes digitatis]|uniref:Uncharacterized protein n=1 Tax=Actinoplanes digitatis TaxID=1868 RepID=A0A7W7HWJ6_9ACTN|nr:hypothetical protein [Actinoplanes digitatis]MBB4762059.1 hypothetical protein [Actinoplanes digitatis]GID97030.1 hypothetical protein Adi01nite_64420 [Actinoplanes digitatis]
MRFWLVAAGCALVFVLAGVFFATRGSLGEADQYASVGSFLLALATLAGTALIAARRRAPERPADDPGGGAATGSRIRIGKIENVGHLAVGDHNTTHVYQDGTGEGPRRKR